MAHGAERWRYQVTRAIEHYQATGQKLYVRGWRKTISHPGAWSYGRYREAWPPIDRDWSREYGCRYCVAEYYDGAPGTPYWVADPSCPTHGDPAVLGFHPGRGPASKNRNDWDEEPQTATSRVASDVLREAIARTAPSC